MNQADIQSAAKRAAQQSKNILSRQVERQAAALGSTLSQTARDLEQVGAQLSQTGTISSAAELAERAASYVDRAGRYLQDGDADQFIADLEHFSRERPWAIAASAATLGFVTARIVKSSSARRFAESGYAATSDVGTSGDLAAAGSVRTSGAAVNGSTNPAPAATPAYRAAGDI